VCQAQVIQLAVTVCPSAAVNSRKVHIHAAPGKIVEQYARLALQLQPFPSLTRNRLGQLIPDNPRLSPAPSPPQWRF